MPKKFHAAKIARNPGIYDNWDQCKKNTDKFPGSGGGMRGFKTRAEAEAFLCRDGDILLPSYESALEYWTRKPKDAPARRPRRRRSPSPEASPAKRPRGAPTGKIVSIDELNEAEMQQTYGKGFQMMLKMGYSPGSM